MHHSYKIIYFLSAETVVIFTQPLYNVSESGLFVEVCVSTNTSLLDLNVTVTLRTGDNSAIGKRMHQCLYSLLVILLASSV